MGDRFGTKRVFLTALGLFVGGSVLCGFAQTISQLVGFRVLQGVGGGMLTPIGVAMLFRAFPPIERARASTIVMIPTLVAPALGPVLGGLLTETLGWRWIFFVNVPFGVAAMAFGLRFLREHKEPTAGPFDIPGFVLSGFGLASIAYALSEGPRIGWTSPLVLLFGIGGLVAFALLVYVETHQPHPMLALRLLKLRLFRATNLVMAFAMAGFIGLTFVMPLYLQGVRGLDPFHSGLTTFPQAIGILISSQIAGRIYPSVGPRRLIVGGMLGAAAAMSCLLLVGLETDLWWIRIIMFLRGFAMGFCFVSSQAAGYAEIAAGRQRTGVGDLLDATADVGHDRRRPDGHRAGELHDVERGADRSRPRPARVPLDVRRVRRPVARVGAAGVPHGPRRGRAARRCSPSGRHGRRP